MSDEVDSKKAAAGPVYQHACIGLGREKTWADVDFNWYEGAPENMRRVMFTAPPADALSMEHANLMEQASIEIKALREALDNERAKGIHSCHANCSRDGCVNRRLRGALEGAANYIDTLGGDSKRYRIAASASASPASKK
jgi:hypothetical protein